MITYRHVGAHFRNSKRAFSWNPWISGTLKLDSVLALFKCVVTGFFLLFPAAKMDPKLSCTNFWCADSPTSLIRSIPGTTRSCAILSAITPSFWTVSSLPSSRHSGSRLNLAGFFLPWLSPFVISYLRMIVGRLVSTKGHLSQLRKSPSLATDGEEEAAGGRRDQKIVPF